VNLTQIAIFSLISLVYAALIPGWWRGWVLLALSIVAVYALQPPLPIRHLDFILPTAAIGLGVFIWLVTQRDRMTRTNLIALGLVAGLVLAMSAMRYINPDWRLTPSRPPAPLNVAIVVLIFGALLVGLTWLLRERRGLLVLSNVALVVLLFIILKTPALADNFSGFLRAQTGQDVTLAAGAVDLVWLGYSYVAFRLLHILVDWREGRLPDVSLRTHLTYTLFFPAYTAGPIDRIERHAKDDAALDEANLFKSDRLVEDSTRIIIGIFKKFIIADSLALFALNEINAAQATSTAGLWLLLYAYAFRLFFDFSGYSDIAIGLARLYGIQLPENFDRPYLKNNITAFWQSWHMTLSQWVRAYVFSPMSRALLKRKPMPSPLLVVFSAQMATMIVIALWHGVTWTFLIWGVWHGIGLFIHKVWSDRTRKWYLSLKTKPRIKQAWTIVGVALTFHFVVLGWVWFALPDAGVAWTVLRGLFGG
jgi:D-alanyl-lipoteichoic acid acyltransferase DltB (MBOAT superfamily)